jgi:hypothetical protein
MRDGGWGSAASSANARTNPSARNADRHETNFASKAPSLTAPNSISQSITGDFSLAGLCSLVQVQPSATAELEESL